MATTENLNFVFQSKLRLAVQTWVSKDRWKIFQIRDEDLLDVTEKYL